MRVARTPRYHATSSFACGALGAALLVACSTSSDEPGNGGPGDGGGSDATVGSKDARADGPGDAGNGDVAVLPADARPASGTFCALPGSYVTTALGPEIIPDPSHTSPDLSWLQLPAGFCAHYFGTVLMARQLRFAPGGDLFVASPTTPTTGGANNGIAGIAILPDDDHDGYADSVVTYLGSLPSTQGLLFTGGFLYYQDHQRILRVPYNPGDRTPSGAAVTVTTITLPQAPEHWPKVMDVAQDGTIYITNGSTQNEACTPDNPVFGAVVSLQTNGGTTTVARGFRNPIAIRCETNHDVCLAAELSLDYSGPAGGREKLVPVQPGDDWGFPCCATQNTPFSGVTYPDGAVPDCTGVASESEAFVIGETPFGIDFEPGLWPSPWTGRAFVSLHGEVEQWLGARLVGVALDPTTGLPQSASDLDGGFDTQSAMDFAQGWGDGLRDHGRPAPLTFAADGRLFLGDDQRGAVVWIAPVGLPRP